MYSKALFLSRVTALRSVFAASTAWRCSSFLYWFQTSAMRNHIRHFLDHINVGVEHETFFICHRMIWLILLAQRRLTLDDGIDSHTAASIPWLLKSKSSNCALITENTGCLARWVSTITAAHAFGVGNVLEIVFSLIVCAVMRIGNIKIFESDSYSPLIALLQA